MPDAEKDAGLAQAPGPCWYPANAEGALDHGDGIPHWQSEAEGREGIASLFADHDGVNLRRETEPCWHLTCTECGYRYDEDEWVSHFPARIDAEGAAEDCDWLVTADEALCHECHLTRALPPATGREATP